MIPRDTSRIAAYARLGSARRVEIAFEMSVRARAIAIEGIRACCPELSHDEAKHLLWRHLLGEQLFEAAFPAAALSRSFSGDVEALWRRARAEADSDEP